MGDWLCLCIVCEEFLVLVFFVFSLCGESVNAYLCRIEYLHDSVFCEEFVTITFAFFFSTAVYLVSGIS